MAAKAAPGGAEPGALAAASEPLGHAPGSHAEVGEVPSSVLEARRRADEIAAEVPVTQSHLAPAVAQPVLLLLLMLAAVQACGGDSAAATCVEENPRGSELAPADVLAAALNDCAADSGACQDSNGCTGSVDGRTCDADKFMSSAAATCIAAAEGMAEGLQGFRVELGYNEKHRRVVWVVTNVLYEGNPDAGPGDFGGQVMLVDAETGDSLELSGWFAIS
jgi:hypothetical protein